MGELGNNLCVFPIEEQRLDRESPSSADPSLVTLEPQQASDRCDKIGRLARVCASYCQCFSP